MMILPTLSGNSEKSKYCSASLNITDQHRERLRHLLNESGQRHHRHAYLPFCVPRLKQCVLPKLTSNIQLERPVFRRGRRLNHARRQAIQRVPPL